jgi:hypothetical protein
LLLVVAAAVAALQSVLLFVIYRKEEIEILTLSFASDGAMAGGWLLSINMEEGLEGGHCRIVGVRKLRHVAGVR